jgi:hypothetical protein
VPTGAGEQRVVLGVDVLGQAPTGLVATVRAAVPTGWSAGVSPDRPIVLTSRGLPVQRSASVTVRVPATAAPGAYPVTVTVAARGTTPVTRTVTVTVRAATACAAVTGGQCAVDLRTERTLDATATVEQSTEPLTAAAELHAALLPPAGPVTWDSVAYDAPDPTGTATNLVPARGQVLLLPEGTHTGLRLIATAFNGPVSTHLTVGYTDGSVAEVPVTVADWCGQPAAGGTGLAMAHRIKAGQGVDGPPVALFALPVPLETGKRLRSLGLPDDPRLTLYALTLT